MRAASNRIIDRASKDERGERSSEMLTFREGSAGESRRRSDAAANSSRRVVERPRRGRCDH
eukprot:2157674-Prymnesium_polylepis.1